MSEKLPPLPGALSKKSSNKWADITIHVCDETKNLKKDFVCSRELILEEMKYFQDYLSSDTEKWEDVDISVHCDIKIFDWLICFVKEKKTEREPNLTTNNVVSILISSDFLKMPSLVDKCVCFLQENMNKVIASPCNMNCINDKLVSRIASTMNQPELESIVDRKDKFKSKLFSKKLEELFQASYEDKYTLNNAAHLYKCSFCRKLLIPQVENDVECLVNRTTLDRFGNFKFKHLRDPNWNVSDYLLALKGYENSWRIVYWRIWSQINFLKCTICDTVFPLCEFMQCLTHADKEFSNPTSDTFSCCQQQRKLFEPIKTRSGCKYVEHNIDLTYPSNSENLKYILNELNIVKDLVCSLRDVRKTDCRNMKHDIRSMMTLLRNESANYSARLMTERKRSANVRAASVRKDLYYGRIARKKSSDDEDSDSDEPGIVRISIQTKNNSPNWRNTSRTWNSDLPFRLNQDMQREKDLKRMVKIIDNLQISNKSIENQITKSDPSCGTFFNLEQKRKKDLVGLQPQSNTGKKGRLSER